MLLGVAISDYNSGSSPLFDKKNSNGGHKAMGAFPRIVHIANFKSELEIGLQA